MRSQSGWITPNEKSSGMPIHVPRRAHRLEQPDHQPADFLAVVAEVGRVLDHRPVLRQPVDLLGDEVVVLGGLQRDVDADGLAELAGPHAGAVDDQLRFDVAAIGAHAGDRRRCAAALRSPTTPSMIVAPFRRAPLASAIVTSTGIRPAVLFHVEPGQHVVGARQREQLGHLLGGDLVHVDTAVAVEGADPAVLLQPVGLGGQLDEADAVEARRLPGLGLQPVVQVAGVLAHLGRRLRHRPERHHQPGGVPGGARRQLVALQHERRRCSPCRPGDRRPSSR